MEPILGVIGGSGLYEIKGIEVREEIKLGTPFGDPSDSLIVGEYKGQKIIFLPRHGRGHRIPPSKINFRANIYSMKMMGVTSLLSISAVGSMKEEIKPGDIVIVDQFYDNTKFRVNTFFDEAVVGHIAFANPVCSAFSDILCEEARRVVEKVHMGGTYICIEGPQFSTRAESLVYRSFGVDVIGMTNIPEAKLAREAALCYGTVALATDYDCWRESEKAVSAEMVISVLEKNIENAKKIILNVAGNMEKKKECNCRESLKNAIMTARELIPPDQAEKLRLIVGDFI